MFKYICNNERCVRYKEEALCEFNLQENIPAWTGSGVRSVSSMTINLIEKQKDRNCLFSTLLTVYPCLQKADKPIWRTRW